MSKKLSLLLAALFMFVAGFAQTEALTEGFEGSAFPPDDWTMTGDWQQNSTSSYHNTGSYGAYVYWSGTSASWLITPQLYVVSGDKLTFYWMREGSYNSSNDSRVMISETGTNTSDFSLLYTITNDGYSSNKKQVTIDLSDYVGKKIYIAFYNNSNSGGDVGLDDISGVHLADVSCPKPKSIVINTDATTGKMSWTGIGDSYDFDYKLDGSSSWTSLSNQTSPISLTGLTSSTKYNYRLRNNCGGEQSDWIEGTFRTTATPYDLVTNNSYEQGFETNDFTGWTTTTSYSNHEADWVLGATAAAKDGAKGLGISNDGGATLNYGYSSGNGYSYASLLVKFGDREQYTLSFDYKCQGENSYDYFSVYICDGSYELPTTGAPSGTNILYRVSGEDSWKSFSQVLEGVKNTTKLIVFYWQNDYYTYTGAAIDNIKIKGTNCLTPTNLAVSNVTKDAATVSWNAGSASKWRVQITTEDDKDWSNLVASIQVTSPTYQRTGLEPQTNYKVRVQAMCDDEDSDWGEISFGTLCDIQQVAVPWTENFDAEDNAIDCWTVTKVSTGSYPNYPQLLTSYQWNVYSGAKALEFKGNSDQMIALPAQFGDDLTELRIRFKYRINGYSGDAKVGVLTDPSNADTWKELVTLEKTGTSASESAWTDAIVPLTDAGTAKNIAIRFQNGGYSTSFYVDDVVVEMIPDCPHITGTLAVVNDSLKDEQAVLAFSDEEGQTSWDFYYKAEDVTEYTKVTTTKDTVKLTDLSAHTTYSAYVARTCNVGKKNAEASNIVTFTTKYNCDKISGTLTRVDTLLDATTASFTFKDNLHTAWTLYYKAEDAEEFNTVELTIDDTIKSDTTVLATINGLTFKTNYVAYVTASCEGIAEPSNTVSFATKPLAIDLDNVTDRTYFVDFDETVPNADNYLIGSTSTTNAWVIGTATGNEGKSLYLSNDGGTTNAYSTNSATKAYVAFRVKFLEGINTYNLSFDYKAPTTSDHNYDDFKAAIIDDNVNPANTYTGSGSSWTFNGKKELVTTRTSSDRTSDWKSYAYMFSDAEALAGTTKWVVFWFNCDGSVGNGSAPAIDNFQIKAGLDCSLEANKQYTEQNIFICAGDETNKMTPGDYVTVVPTVEWGCDSTITLHVQIATDSTVEAPIDVFDTELPYIMNGHEYAQAGTYTDSVATDGGCYNLTHFTLNVIPSYNTDYSDTLNVVLCEGQNYTVTYFDYETEETVEEVLTEARTYVYELKSILGSDSIVIVDLKLNPVYKIELEPVTLCLGEVYDANGFYKKENRAGEYDYTLSLKTVNDCDSIITVHVTVNPVYNDTVELTVKSSEEQLVDNGRVVLDELPFGIDTISAPSTKSAFETYTKTDALQTINGCDSLVTYNYTVLRSYYDTTHTHVVICNGETYTVEYPDYTAEDEEDLIKSVTYSTTTNSTLNLVAFNGADSVLKIDVTVLGEMDETTVDTNICFGGVFELDGVEYTENGIYKTTLQTEELGCDSVVAYNVTFLDNYVHHDDIVINEGTTYTVTWDGGSKELTAAGEYTLYNTKTVSGDCDSIYTVTLTVRTTQRDTTSMGEFCKGDASVQPGSKTVEGFEQ